MPSSLELQERKAAQDRCASLPKKAGLCQAPPVNTALLHQQQDEGRHGAHLGVGTELPPPRLALLCLRSSSPLAAKMPAEGEEGKITHWVSGGTPLPPPPEPWGGPAAAGPRARPPPRLPPPQSSSLRVPRCRPRRIVFSDEEGSLCFTEMRVYSGRLGGAKTLHPRQRAA